MARQREAKLLLDAGEHWGAYYLTGYAVECALKACIVKQFPRHTIPDRKLVNDFYTHEVDRLLSLTTLRKSLLSDPKRELNWTIIKDWSEQARYNSDITSSLAHDLYQACTMRTSGVLPWLHKHW